jgi:ABC-2 type transport system permease protein
MLRLVVVGWRFQLENFTRSALFVISSIVQPVLFASIAFFLDRAGGHGALLYTALGAGLMGTWSSTLFGSGMAIQSERRQGTLELMILAPPPYLTVLSSVTLATASLGIYSLAATLLWGRLFFGVALHLAHPLLFVLAIGATVVALGLFGLVLGSTFVLWRGANALANLLEYPVWLATGLLVPVKLLPAWVTPISWLLAPTWGAEAIRRAALGGAPLPPIGMCAVLGVAYLAFAALMLRYLERLARARASLALA